jgi:hypothetical protein
MIDCIPAMLLLLLLVLGTLVFATTTTHRNIAQGATRSPVATTILAEMARLSETVIVVVAELGVQRLAARARHHLIWWFQAAFLECTLSEELTRLLLLLL